MNKATHENAYWSMSSQGQNIHKSTHSFEFFDGEHRFLQPTKATEALTYRELFELVEAAQNFASDSSASNQVALITKTLDVFGQAAKRAEMA